MTTVIDLLRHGEVEGGQHFRGRTDDALTAEGWRQMQEQCREGHWDHIVASPLRRCAAFADQLGDRLGIPVVVDEAWREIDFGCWDGMTADAIEQTQPGALQRYYDDPSAFTPEGAEPYPVFFERVIDAWQRVRQDHRGRRVLVICHAGVIRTVFAHVLALTVPHSFQVAVPHACLTRFTCFDDGDHSFTQLSFHRPL